MSTFPSSTRDASHLSQQLRCASSSTKHRHRVLSSSSKAVRCKLLHKLGITPKSTNHQHSSTTRTSSSPREYLRNVPRYKQLLKYTHDHRCRRPSIEEEREPSEVRRRSSTTQYRSSTLISSSPQRVILSDDDIEKLRNEISTLFLDDDERRQHPSPTHRRQSSPKCVSSFPMIKDESTKKKKKRSVGFQETVTVVP
jgi:hypothetical protein